MSKSTLTTQAQVDAQTAALRRALPVTVPASRAFAVTDEGQMVTPSVDALTLTIPTDAAVPIPVGAYIDVLVTGVANTATVTTAAGVYLWYAGGGGTPASYSVGHNAAIRLVKTSTTTWLLYPLTDDDTGWLPLPTPVAGFTAQDNAAYRRISNEVRFRGSLLWTGSGGPTVAFTLPVGFRPTTVRRYSGATDQSATHMGIRVQINGDVDIRYAVTSSNFCSLNDIRYELD